MSWRQKSGRDGQQGGQSARGSQRATYPGKRTRVQARYGLSAQTGAAGPRSGGAQPAQPVQRTPATEATHAHDWSSDPNQLAALGFCPLESDDPGSELADSEPAIDAPTPGINKPGFIDNGDGANIRTGPAELHGATLTPQPLPPATRVFVSGQHPEAPAWWYVSAQLSDILVRGYVQNFRVNTDLPEPSAKLYQIQSGDTVEKLAVREFSASVRDGHDLRYYENVLLAVNRDKNRAGIKGTFQDPGILGGGANNIQLEAGRRIWLVSPAYARALEGSVPDGSLTNGSYAKARRALAHIDDLISSVTSSPIYFGTVAGEYAEAITDHLPEIIGITAAFILAESASAFLAATPTGVGQLAAAVIQLGLAAFGASFAYDAGADALGHGEQWLSLAWTAKGDPGQLAAASQEFLKMLVSIAAAALALMGVRGNIRKGIKIAKAVKIQPPSLGWSPAMVTPEGGMVPGGPVFMPGSIATTGPVDISASAMSGIGSGGSRLRPGESSASAKESALASGGRDADAIGQKAMRNPLRVEKGLAGSKKHGLKWTEGPARAKATGKPQGQFGSQADLDFVESAATGLSPGQSGNFALPAGHSSVVHLPDGSTVPATRVWMKVRQSGTIHAYPME